MFAQYFIDVVFGLDPIEINGLFDTIIDPCQEQVGDNCESFEEIPMLAQYFIDVVFGLDPIEINGLFDTTIDPL